MRTLILVPMKEPQQSKTRLSDSLSTKARERLACLLYSRTLAFLWPVADKTSSDLAVVTSSKAASAIAKTEGVRVITEPTEGDLSQAVEFAANWAKLKGYQRLCIIPADLIAPDKNDLLRLLDSKSDVTICPSQDMGTNALLVNLANPNSFHYGAKSALRHKQVAEQLGLSLCMLPLDSLKFDLDTSDNLARAIASVPQIKAVCQ